MSLVTKMSSSIQDEMPPSQNGSCASSILKTKQKVVKPSRLMSMVWQYFSRSKDPILGMIATCNHCKIVYKANTTNNETSNMRNHISKCPVNPANLETKFRSKK